MKCKKKKSATLLARFPLFSQIFSLAREDENSASGELTMNNENGSTRCQEGVSSSEQYRLNFLQSDFIVDFVKNAIDNLKTYVGFARPNYIILDLDLRMG
jgi:hypothetical protein